MIDQKLIEEIAEKHAEQGVSTRGLVIASIRAALTEYVQRSVAPEAAVTAEPVAWIVQAKDAPLAPKYLNWKKEPHGMATANQCNYAPLYSHPPAAGMMSVAKPCAHEWYYGKCVHCEITPSEHRASKTVCTESSCPYYNKRRVDSCGCINTLAAAGK